MSVADLRKQLKNIRIAAFDYGLKRVGWAVCDEYHITTNTKGVFLRSAPDFWEQVVQGLQRERVGFVLVGVPLREHTKAGPMVEKTREFARLLQEKSGLNVLEVDESFSSKRAVQTMVQIGVPKMKRRDKERTDEISAAIVLRDFLLELE